MNVHVRVSAAVASLAGALVAVACLGAAGPARAADSTAHQLRVDYHPPHLSVEARGVPVARVLEEIGARAGFSVVNIGASSIPVSVSIRDASVEEALRQLLRAENHSVLYVQGSGAARVPGFEIDRIVLLGPAGPINAALRPGSAPPPSVGTASATGAPPPAPSTWLPETPPSPSVDAADPPTSVGDILRTHAMSAAQAAREPTDDAPAASTPPASIDAVLAETTRRAQRDLSALVNGLGKVTRSLQDSRAAGRQ